MYHEKQLNVEMTYEYSKLRQHQKYILARYFVLISKWSVTETMTLQSAVYNLTTNRKFSLSSKLDNLYSPEPNIFQCDARSYGHWRDNYTIYISECVEIRRYTCKKGR